MNKTNKRFMNLRNKLFAAIAMLLVSSIMMVSSTYAWFTLSTAPEVQGITTTVGANGNLEIALSPASGSANDLGKASDGTMLSEVGIATQDWAVKNHTWGNLISMTEEDGTDIYGLSEIALLPSRLNVLAGSNGANAKLGDNPLMIPVYGSDGRIASLSADGIVVGGRDGDSFNVTTPMKYGVRAVGTSSSMSQTALNFQNALSAINANRLTANGLAADAITVYGGALAAIAIKHANGDDADYQEHSDTLNGMLDMLTRATDAMEQSLFNALLALASTEVGASVVSYDDVKAAMTAGTPLETLWPDETGVTMLDTAYTEWSNANTNISTAKGKLDALATDENWSWSEVSGALVSLVDISDEEAVTMNGFKISELESHISEILAAGGLYLQMNDGSGVFDNIAKLTGKITGQVTVPAGLSVKGISVGGVPVNIVSTGTPAAGAYLVQLRTAIGGMTVAGDNGGAVQPIDVTYGYGVDFMFRTNVANSSLLLQTEAAQRVYSDSQNAETLGNGSTMSFKGTNIDSLLSMMDGIRIVFTNTADNSIYGIAKLDQTSYKISYQVTTEGEGEGAEATTETKTGTLTIAADGTKSYEGVPAPEAGTEVTLTGFVRMYNYTIGDSGLVFSASTKDTICSMPQNGVVRVTAWVFLDGDAIDNTDVTNSETGVSTTGSLNLQFASSAALVPMQNTDLFNGSTEG